MYIYRQDPPSPELQPLYFHYSHLNDTVLNTVVFTIKCYEQNMLTFFFSFYSFSQIIYLNQYNTIPLPSSLWVSNPAKIPELASSHEQYRVINPRD
jgi:hypothetical protein